MRYVIGVISILVVILLLVLGFKFIKGLLTNDKPKKTDAPVSNKINLDEVGKDGKPVQYTIRGSINGDEQHHSIRFTVDDKKRKVEILQGYSDRVTKSQETENNADAYKAFVDALKGAGFSQSIQPEGRGDETLNCPLGKRYNYEINPGTSDGMRTWGNSCSSKQGTFSGNGELVRRLFQLQIPEYNDFAKGTNLTI